MKQRMVIASELFFDMEEGESSDDAIKRCIRIMEQDGLDVYKIWEIKESENAEV